ncbi:Peptidase, M48 family [Brevinematales bacterium NS]|nr:M48 family metallopeptidase [Brevinematales bacterium]QJR20873.1 Peptidase, M48 family [Brevinematales bacterium NS]
MTEYRWLFVLTLVLTVVRFFWKQFLRYLNYRYLKKHKGEIPPLVREYFSPEDMEKSESYMLAHMRYGTWQGVFDFAVLLWWVFGGGFLWLYQMVVGWHLSFVWTGIVLTWLSTLFFMVIEIPWDLYETFVLEAKYGFTTMTFGIWLSDQIKGLLLSVVLELPLLWIVLSLIQGLPQWWWFVVWVVYSLFDLFVMYIAPYVIEPLFNKYEPLENEYGDPIREWAEKQGVSVKAVLKMDASRRTKHSNAYFTGIGRVKRIVVFDTLLENFSMEEILAILSHELGHWKRHHILKQLIFAFVFSLVAVYISFHLLQLRLFSLAFGVGKEIALSSYGFFSELFFLGIFISGVAIFTQPIAAYFSRKREREADAYAVRVMGRAKPLQSALIKLYRENLSTFHVHPLVVAMTYSHPPLLDRLDFLSREEGKLKG